MHIICLHNVIGPVPDAFDQKCSRISAAQFEGFLRSVEARYRLIPFSECLRRLDEKRTDPKAVALSFDDGFQGVRQYALPVLRERKLDAAAFICPPFLRPAPMPVFHFLELEIAFRLTKRSSLRLDFLDQPLKLTTTELRVKAMRRVKRSLKTAPETAREASHRLVLSALGVPLKTIRDYAFADEKFRVMNHEDILELRAAGWSLGAHTLTHRTLGMLDGNEVRAEILQSKSSLEEILEESVPLFAYPYGESVHVGRSAPGVCREGGCRYAFTTIPGCNSNAENPFLLKRSDYKIFRRDFLPHARAGTGGFAKCSATSG